MVCEADLQLMWDITAPDLPQPWTPCSRKRTNQCKEKLCVLGKAPNTSPASIRQPHHSPPDRILEMLYSLLAAAISNSRSHLEKGIIKPAGRSRRQDHKRQEQAITWIDRLENGREQKKFWWFFSCLEDKAGVLQRVCWVVYSCEV